MLDRSKCKYAYQLLEKDSFIFKEKQYVCKTVQTIFHEKKKQYLVVCENGEKVIIPWKEQLIVKGVK